jgi:hypothetical protein
MLRPAGDDVLKVWPVSRHVTSPTNNGAELLEGGTFEPDGGDGYLCVAEINTRADSDAALRMRRLCLILAPIPLSSPAY